MCLSGIKLHEPPQLSCTGLCFPSFSLSATLYVEMGCYWQTIQYDAEFNGQPQSWRSCKSPGFLSTVSGTAAKGGLPTHQSMWLRWPPGKWICQWLSYFLWREFLGPWSQLTHSSATWPFPGRVGCSASFGSFQLFSNRQSMVEGTYCLQKYSMGALCELARGIASRVRQHKNSRNSIWRVYMIVSQVKGRCN